MGDVDGHTPDPSMCSIITLYLGRLYRLIDNRAINQSRGPLCELLVAWVD